MDTTYIHKDLLSCLPTEIAEHVLKFLDIPGLCACTQVSRAWRTCALADTLYIPYVRQASESYRDAGDMSVKTNQQWLEQFDQFSASGYFDKVMSHRDAAIRSYHLEESWKKGIPTKAVNFNAERKVHNGAIRAVVVDKKGHMIITADETGKVVFWDVRSGRCTGILDWEYKELPLAMTLAVSGDILAVGTFDDSAIDTGRVQIARRSAEGNGFVSDFKVVFPKLVTSVLIVRNVCIAGELTGDITILSLAPNVQDRRLLFLKHPKNETELVLTMHYHKPYLYVTNRDSNSVKQYAPRVLGSMVLDLWEYACEKVVRLASVRQGRFRTMAPCLLAPIGVDGDLLVSWPNTAIYKLTRSDEECFWNPSTNVLLETDRLSVYGLANRHGYFVIGSHEHDLILCDRSGQQLRLFNDQNACLSSRGIATDPAFIVMVCEGSQVLVYFFDPTNLPAYIRANYPEKETMLQRGLEFKSKSGTTDNNSTPVAPSVDWYQDLEIVETPTGYRYAKRSSNFKKGTPTATKTPVNFQDPTCVRM